MEACERTSLAPTPDPGHRRGYGRTGAHSTPVVCSRERGVGRAALFNFLCSSSHCSRDCLLEWMPFLCFKASFLFLGPTTMADGCCEMTTRMLHWKNTWYIGLDKEGDVSSAFGVLSRSG